MIVLEIKASRQRHIGDLSRSDNTEIEREDRANAVRFQWYGVLVAIDQFGEAGLEAPVGRPNLAPRGSQAQENERPHPPP